MSEANNAFQKKKKKKKKQKLKPSKQPNKQTTNQQTNQPNKQTNKQITGIEALIFIVRAAITTSTSIGK